MTTMLGEAPEGVGTAVPTPSPSPHRGHDRPEVSLGYVAGFDGLRAIGLLVMLAYHHGIAAARGGIFTVSMFFTLSGFLIATLALQEWSRSGSLSLRRFWERRARRLLPAAVVTVVGVVVLQAAFDVGAGPRFREDVLYALGYAANWRMAYSGADYAAIFAIESPVQHFWSLAVEEQFYVAFPLLFVGLMALTRGRWRLVGAAFGLGAAASFVAAWYVASQRGNSGLAYYAAYTRASEILVGVAVAFLVVTSPVRRFLSRPLGVRAARVGGVLGLAGMLLLWTTVSLKSPWVFRGATALNATLTCLVVLACISPAPGVLARAIGVWPLRSLGRISYAVYLFHWPIFLLLDSDRTGLGYRSLFVLRVGLTIGLAVVSYHLLESPFRFRLRMPQPRLAVVFAATGVAAVVLTLLVPVGRGKVIDLAAAEMETLRVEPKTVVVPQGSSTPAADILLVGDSVAWTMAPGMNTWNKRHPDQQVRVTQFISMGCTLGTAAPTRFLGTRYDPWADCLHFRDTLAETLRTHDYDVVVVMMGNKDLGEREVAGEWRALGDDEFDTWFAHEIADFADVVGEAGAPVVWATLPHTQVVPKDSQASWTEFSNNDPERVDRLNALVAAELEDRERFEHLDLAGWLQESAPGGELDRDYRYDGVHWTFQGSDAAAEFTIPRVLDVLAAVR